MVRGSVPGHGLTSWCSGASRAHTRAQFEGVVWWYGSKSHAVCRLRLYRSSPRRLRTLITPTSPPASPRGGSAKARGGGTDQAGSQAASLPNVDEELAASELPSMGLTRQALSADV